MKRFAPLLAEFLGDFVFLFVIGLAVANGWDNTALAIGVALAILIYVTGWVSGGHLNPAVTIGLVARGKHSVADGIAYIIVQIIGGTLGLLLATQLGASADLFGGVTSSASSIFIAELVFTFLLVATVLHVAASPKADGNSYYAAAIGLSVFVGATVVGGISGGAFNPAVALAGLFASGGSFASAGILVYLAAQVIGGLLAAGFHAVSSSVD